MMTKLSTPLWRYCRVMILLLIACAASACGIGAADPAPQSSSASVSSPPPTSVPTATMMPVQSKSIGTAITQTQEASPTATSEPAGTPVPLIIGTSVAGRPLEVFRFGEGQHARMIVAGIHGGYEGNTIRLAQELVQVLAVRSDLIPPDITLYILRALNPDGEARSSSYKGRVNDNLVDLNRNWPALWQSSWPSQGCWTYTYVTAGSGPASEPETRALLNFLISYQIEALISYHSAALGIFPGGQPPDAASISLAEALGAVSDYPYPPIETGCMYTGQLIDWASNMGIAAVDIELSNHNDSDLYQNMNVLQAFLAWELPTGE
jgi:protein MpaA